MTTVPKFKNLGEKAIRFDLPWPVEILEDISRGDFAMVEWAPYLDVVIKDQYTKNKRCDFSVSVIFFVSNVFGMAAMPIPLWSSDCIPGCILAYIDII